MAKKVNGYVKLQVPAGAANPAPPIGPALGQQGVAVRQERQAERVVQPARDDHDPEQMLFRRVDRERSGGQFHGRNADVRRFLRRKSDSENDRTGSERENAGGGTAE